MKTFTMLSAAVVALTASMTFAQAADYGRTAAGFGPCPDGFCGTTAACADGSCGHVACTDGSCGVAGCPGGNCGHLVCKDGTCGVGRGYGYGAGATSRTGWSTQPRTAGYRPPVGYGYAAPTAACPTGNCPRTPVGAYGAGYRAPAASAVCPNGQCPPTALPRYQSRPVPRISFLGLTW